MSRTIQGRFFENLERDPARHCISFVDVKGEFAWLSREEFFFKAMCYGGVLHEKGLCSGDAGVVVSVDPEHSATTVLAMLMLGARPLLVAPPAIQGVNSSLKSVVRHVVEKTGAKVALLPEEMAGDEAELKAANPGAHLEFGFAGLAAGEVSRDPEPAPSPNSIAAMQLTSGTTGFPRIAVWEQERMIAGIEGMARGMGVGSDDIYLNWTPLYHDMGLVNNFLCCMVNGIPLVLLSPIDVIRRPALWMRVLQDSKATTTWSPNFGFAVAADRCTEAELEGVRLDHVKGFWNAAERIHLDTFKKFHERFEPYGVKWEALKSNFGCVESIGGATFSDPDGPLVAERVDIVGMQKTGMAETVTDTVDLEQAQWIVSCGQAYPGLEVHIFDADGEELPDGAVGEVGLKTDARLVEYLDLPDETAAAIRGEYLFTGDLGYMRGPEFFWTGRKRERINLHGKKYDPSEFEAVVFDVEGLRKGCFVAFGLDDVAQGTQKLVIIVEVDDPIERSYRDISKDVRREVTMQLGVTIGELALVPKGTLTKTSSGKRRHRHFRNLYLGGELEILYETGVSRID